MNVDPHALLCGHVTQVLDIVRTHQFRSKSVVCGACNRASFELRPSVKEFFPTAERASLCWNRYKVDKHQSPVLLLSSRTVLFVPVLAHPVLNVEAGSVPPTPSAGWRQRDEQSHRIGAGAIEKHTLARHPSLNVEREEPRGRSSALRWTSRRS